jgi:hypothetical protein
MSTKPESKKNDLYNISATLLGDVEVRQAQTKTGPKPYAYVKVQAKNEKVITVMTFVTAGINALQGKTAGTLVRLFGTYTPVKNAEGKVTGRTFSAMGISPERPAKAAKAA